ncbi:MAG: glycosyltransferase [Bacteroidales bacterium]|nr:glycosyltransferase [Bacteroidales bacterium]
MVNPVRVSVAIITYNQKEFIQECIESVLNQDYPNIEIVVADDGSSDGTQGIVKEYASKYPDKFVCKLSENNKGITKNSNLAHFACTGKYIAWMGGDDIMLPGKIKKQVEHMENHPECSVCYHNLEVFDSDTGDLMFYSNDLNRHFEGKMRIPARYGTFNGACSTMVRRADTPPGGFDERILIASDWLYWVETLANGAEIQYIDEVLARYRRHKNSVTNRNIDENFTDHFLSSLIMLNKYPQLRKDVYYRMSRKYRQYAKYRKEDYIKFLFISMKFSFYYKNIISILLYYLSFKKVRI